MSSFKNCQYRYITETSILTLQLSIIDLFIFNRFYLNHFQAIFLFPIPISQKISWRWVEILIFFFILFCFLFLLLLLFCFFFQFWVTDTLKHLKKFCSGLFQKFYKIWHPTAHSTHSSKLTLRRVNSIEG